MDDDKPQVRLLLVCRGRGDLFANVCPSSSGAHHDLALIPPHHPRVLSELVGLTLRRPASPARRGLDLDAAVPRVLPLGRFSQALEHLAPHLPASGAATRSLSRGARGEEEMGSAREQTPGHEPPNQ